MMAQDNDLFCAQALRRYNAAKPHCAISDDCHCFPVICGRCNPSPEAPGSSRVPSWRLPLSLRNVRERPAFVTAALHRDFDLTVRNTWELGGSYFSSPGVTPEVFYPFVVEVETNDITSSPLHFIDSNLFGNNVDQLHDGHLLISTHRLRHALSN
jgi:hypothetical protein